MPMTIPEIKKYLDEMGEVGGKESSNGWLEGFVAGLNEGGVITSDELDDMLEYIAKM